MRIMKNIGALASMTLLAASASAQLTLSYTVPSTIAGNPSIDNQVIPYWDQGLSSDTRVVSGHGSATIQDLQVSLDITTTSKIAMNGDYAAWITHTVGTTTTTAWLLNRPGKDPTLGFGYFDSAGMNITLSDKAATDVHVYQTDTSVNPNPPDTVQLTGTFQPDGRANDPRSVLTSSPRNALLSVFNGQTIDGTWTVNITDYQSSAGDGKFVSWGLTFTNVPEPSQYAILAGLGLIGFAAYRRFALKAC